MGNMSANILREIVSRTFNVRPTTIKLSGVIDPEYKCYKNTCWSTQTTEHDSHLWGFHEKEGFVELTDIIRDGGHNYGDGSWADCSTGNSLCHIENVDRFIFFVVNETARAYDDRQSFNNWFVFKAPNFQEHLKKVEEADIARWEQWLNS